MEESEKRRERLKAMRAVADEAEASNNTIENPSGLLANPMLAAPEVHEEPFAAQRFDFYTDPMAVFSTNNKKRGAAAIHTGSNTPRFSSSPCTGPRNPGMTPPIHQVQGNYSPGQQMYHAQGPYHGTASTPYRSLGSTASPFPMHQRTPTDVWGGPGMTSSYPMHQRNPCLGAMGSPNFNFGRGRAHWLGNSPRAGPRGSHTTSGRGQGQCHSGNVSPHVGRSPGRGRGFHSHSHGSASDATLGPESFYQNSMVEDPWQHLEPVVWRGLGALPNRLHTSLSSKSWLPKSIPMKKPRVSETSNKPGSQQSIAEYLAASFHDAVDDAPSV